MTSTSVSGTSWETSYLQMPQGHRYDLHFVLNKILSIHNVTGRKEKTWDRLTQSTIAHGILSVIMDGEMLVL